MRLAETGIDLIEAFKEITSAIDHLANRIVEDGRDGYYAWVSQDEFSGKSSPHRDKAVAAIRQITFLEHQDPKTTIDFPGLVGASTSTIEAVVALNAAKDKFKDAVMAVKELQNLNDEEIPELIPAELYEVRNENVKAALRRAGMARLSLKQTYRHIPIATFKDKETGRQQFVSPIKVAWTWGHKRSIYASTVHKEIQKLHKSAKNQKNVLDFIEKLSALGKASGDGGETRIARIHEKAPRLLANLVLPVPDEEGNLTKNDKGKPNVQRTQASAGLPLFYLAQHPKDAPAYKPIPENRAKDTSRLERSDQEIESAPFIKALHLHLYHETAYKLNQMSC